MTKHTARDKVWAAALEVADSRAMEGSSFKRRFEWSEVRARIPEEERPSDRTIRDVLATMADLDVIDSRRRQGEFEPIVD